MTDQTNATQPTTELAVYTGAPTPALIQPVSVPRPTTFSYGYTKVTDLQVETQEDPKKKRRMVTGVLVDGELVEPTPRFWVSLQALYGFSANIFEYFDYDEVFNRVSERRTNDRLRYCIQRSPSRPPQLLAASRPEKALIQYDDAMEVLQQYHGDEIQYLNGQVNSCHTPRIGSDSWNVGSDRLVNRFCMEIPIDGYGKPSIYLACVRLACTNGSVVRAPAFRTELNLGKGDDVVRASIIRALDGFNSDEGYSALKQRFTSAGQSWASVYEATSLYKVLIAMHSRDRLIGQTVQRTRGEDAGDVEKTGSQLLTNFHKVTGDISSISGLASLDALSAKRQRSLPVKCSVYDLINLATEIGTHHSSEAGRQIMDGWVGGLIGSQEGYDMEGTKEKWTEFQDFFTNVDPKTTTK